MRHSLTLILLLAVLSSAGLAHADQPRKGLGDTIHHLFDGTLFKQQAQPEVKDAIKDIKDSVVVKFPTSTKGKRIEGIGYLFMPPDFTPKHAPVPVMFILHGSLGIVKGREDAYAREFARMGMAAFIIDSYGPRGIANTVDDQRQITNDDFLRDAFSALDTLGKDPYLDVTRSGILGFSRGGAIALLSAYLEQRKAYRFIKNRTFKAHYLFYPGCATHFYHNQTTGAPITFFLAQNDNYTGAAPCVDLARELKTNGADATTIIYPDAGHDWDIAGTENHPNAEVRLKCRFEQQANGIWNEASTGAKQIPDIEGPLYKKTLNACITRGATSQGNAQVRQQAIDSLKELVRKQVIEYKSPEPRKVNQPPRK